MSKFYYVTREQVYLIEKLLEDRDPSRQIVLNESDRFKDVVRYNKQYDTAVFLTICTDQN